jgi:hypothetical protein
MIDFSGTRIRQLPVGDSWFCWAQTGKRQLVRLDWRMLSGQQARLLAELSRCWARPWWEEEPMIE